MAEAACVRIRGTETVFNPRVVSFMIRYECDRCGAGLRANDPQRYIVKIEIYAAAGPAEISDDDLRGNAGSVEELVTELARADPDEIEDQVYRCFRLDLCDQCRKALIAKPLG
ncbi:MAG: hypothetical protein JSU68_03675 [Phycisphaerales bacterium]|nr:MAG: hypothetical protein JSU68_03675 [Phycisphaerales bacterium]